MKTNIESKIDILLQNGKQLNERSMFFIVGELTPSREQVYLILSYL